MLSGERERQEERINAAGGHGRKLSALVCLLSLPSQVAQSKGLNPAGTATWGYRTRGHALEPAHGGSRTYRWIIRRTHKEWVAMQ